jgi:hypothetical protein
MANGENTNAILGILKGVAPTLATALGGPAAGAAVAWLSARLGVPIEKVQETVAGMTPDQLIKMKELDYEFQKFVKENDIKLDLGQIEVNKIEASSSSLFVAGWRPFLGWIGGIGIGYQFLLRPLFNGIIFLFGGSYDTFASLEMQDLIAIVVTMLGHSALRSMDKKNGVAT